MTLKLPPSLARKANKFPESSYGACKATLVLTSGRRVNNVVLAWGGEIVKVGGVAVGIERDLGFSLSEIADVVEN